MADATLNDIKKQLLENKKSQVAGDKTLIDAVDDVGDSIEKMVKLYTRSLLDKEEERREGQKQVSRASGGGSSGSSSRGIGLFPGLGLAGLIQPLTAGIVAFGAAMSGLRGWELKAIANMKTLLEKSIPISIQNGVTKIRNSVFRIFGLTPQGVLSRDALGRFTKTPPITSQIAMRMNALRLRTLAVFGIGADGKLITTPAWQRFASKKNLVGRVAIQIRSLFNPIVKGGEKLGEVFKGKLWQNISGLFKGAGGAAGGFLRVVGTILKPLGFFFSAWKGVKAFLDGPDEDGIISNIGKGVSTFVGNFFGAPLDLLKKGVTWAMKYFFGLESDKDGNVIVDPDNLPSKITSVIEKFSFEKLIQSIVQIPFDFYQGAINWIAKFFKDPMGTLDEAWKGVKAGVASVADFVGDWVKGVWEWIKGFLPDVSAIAANFTNKMFNALPDWAKETIRDMEQARYAAPVFDSNVEAIKTRTAGLTQRTNGNTIIQLNQQTGGGAVAKQASVAASTVGGTEDLGAKLMMQGGGNIFMMNPLNPFLE